MIQFNENTLVVGQFGKNTNKVLALVSALRKETVVNQKTSESKHFLLLNFDAFNQEKFLQNVRLKGEVADLDKLKQIEVPEDFELNAISGLKKIRDQITTVLNLTEGVDFKIMSREKWEHDDMGARVSLPIYLSVENQNLRALIDHVDGKVQAEEAYKYKDGDNFVLYFLTIAPEHLPILEAPDVVDSILVEYK